MCKHTISLKVVPVSQIGALLNRWGDDLSYRSEPTGTPTRDDLFDRYLLRNRPNATCPIRSIFSCVHRRYQGFGILERPYLDLDFWDNHSTYYSGSFTRYPVECERLHFFSGNDDAPPRLREMLVNGADERDIANDLAVEYLGYCVLRPTPAFVVGRTALAFDETPGEEVPPEVLLAEAEKKAKPFLKTMYPCSVHLCNARFEINTVEFIQQDPNLGHCGTASLWVATRAMANNFGTASYQYGTITRQAVRGWNRERDVHIVYDPSNMDSGLSVSEMRNALAETGAHSLQFMPHSKEGAQAAFARICHEVYSFLESELPVLLCVQRVDTKDAHVVVAVGHSLPAEVNLKEYPRAQAVFGSHEGEVDREKCHYLMSNLVQLYYAHDDAYGPFNRVVFVEGQKAPSDGHKMEKPLQEPRIRVELGRMGNEYWLRQVLVPVPKVVRNYASQAEVVPKSWTRDRRV